MKNEVEKKGGVNFWALLSCKCPSCHKGNMFKHGLFHPKFLRMHQRCPVCNTNFYPEPGFYFSAMYFSYAINIAIMVFFGVGTHILFDPQEMWVTFCVVLIPPILLTPLTFRISRTLAFYLLGSYEKKTAIRQH